MTWQDALRAKIQRMLDSETDPYAAGVLVAVQMCIDDTAAEHPDLVEVVKCGECAYLLNTVTCWFRDYAEAAGLVDLSLRGLQCPACGDADEDGWSFCVVEKHAVYVGDPCPVLAALMEATP